MYKILRITLALFFLNFQVSQSFAGNSTANATAGAGDYVYAVKTDGSGHFGGIFSLCDGTALASCVTVTGGSLSATISAALPAGTNVIGHAIIDTGSTTAVTQATAASLNATVVGTGTFAVQATLQASSATAIGTVNPTTAANWGIGATGSAVPANAIFSGGTDGTNLRGFLVDSTGRANIIGTGPASTAMQSGATGNGNGSTLTVTGYATALVNVSCSVACSGGTTINFEGTDSTGTFFSVAGYPIGGGSSSTTATTTGQFLVPVTSLTTLRARISAYSAGTITVTGTAFYGTFPAVSTSAGGTSSNFGSSFPSAGTAIGLTSGTNMIAWSATTNFGSSPAAIAVPAVNAAVTSVPSGAVASGAYASGSLAAGAGTDGWNVTEGAKADAVCGSATGTCSITALIKYLNSQVVAAVPAGANVIGKVGVDQTTFGTTNGVVSAANTYNTIAASQTAQAMTGGGGGASGDYLSHCVVTPGTTSPGVVTILDNAGAVVSFAGGASSVSNLVSFAIPIGAKSTSGAWKITTGINVTVVCVGKFT